MYIHIFKVGACFLYKQYLYIITANRK